MFLTQSSAGNFGNLLLIFTGVFFQVFGFSISSRACLNPEPRRLTNLSTNSGCLRKMREQTPPPQVEDTALPRLLLAARSYVHVHVLKLVWFFVANDR